MPDETAVLERLAVSKDDYPNVYWIGRKARWVTFHSQQLRALNLVWALAKTNQLGPGTRVTVVGAGLAGITAAYAAWQSGAEVTLFEKTTEPLHLQRGCRLRVVHPTIIEWPSKKAGKAMTDLPCLNWGAGTADQVCDSIIAQWRIVEPQIDVRFEADVSQVTRSDGLHPVIQVESGGVKGSHTCDCLILAVGFGLEYSYEGFPLLSYWHNDNFDRPVLSPPRPRKYLVTGSGDGGLIDAARLAIGKFDHAEFVYQLTRTKDMKKVKESLLEAEQWIKETMGNPEEVQRRWREEVNDLPPGALGDLEQAGDDRLLETPLGQRLLKDVEARVIEEAYNDIAVPGDPRSHILGERRRDTTVYLNGPRILPWSLKSSVLNRFVLFLLIQGERVTYCAGEPTITHVGAGALSTYRATFDHPTKPSQPLMFHEAVFRHGVESAIKCLLPPDIVKACEWGLEDSEDPTQVLCDKSFLQEPRLKTDDLMRSRAKHALANVPLAANDHFNPAMHDRFTVEITGNTPKYVVRHARPATVSPATERASEVAPAFYDIAIEFEDAASPTRSQVSSSAQSLTGFASLLSDLKKSTTEGTLTWGTAVQDESLAKGKPKFDAVVATRASLGCVVRLLSTGRYALLTTASALGSPWAIEPDDEIHRVGNKDANSSEPIACVTNIEAPVASSPGSSLAANTARFNRLDAVVAELMPGIRFEMGLPEQSSKAASGRDLQAPSAGELLHARVVKAGAVSEVTSGQVASVNATAEVEDLPERYWYKDVFMIAGDGDAPFALPGDGGAAILREDDGTVLGLILGTNGTKTLACPIGPILEKFACELVDEGEQPPITPAPGTPTDPS
jgi:cation diffusion facilitator CzcD-associated flavoprotein CzcO